MGTGYSDNWVDVGPQGHEYPGFTSSKAMTTMDLELLYHYQGTVDKTLSKVTGCGWLYSSNRRKHTLSPC